MEWLDRFPDFWLGCLMDNNKVDCVLECFIYYVNCIINSELGSCDG